MPAPVGEGRRAPGDSCRAADAGDRLEAVLELDERLLTDPARDLGAVAIEEEEGRHPADAVVGGELPPLVGADVDPPHLDARVRAALLGDRDHRLHPLADRAAPAHELDHRRARRARRGEAGSDASHSGPGALRQRTRRLAARLRRALRARSGLTPVGRGDRGRTPGARSAESAVPLLAPRRSRGAAARSGPSRGGHNLRGSAVADSPAPIAITPSASLKRSSPSTARSAPVASSTFRRWRFARVIHPSAHGAANAAAISGSADPRRVGAEVERTPGRARGRGGGVGQHASEHGADARRPPERERGAEEEPGDDAAAAAHPAEPRPRLAVEPGHGDHPELLEPEEEEREAPEAEQRRAVLGERPADARSPPSRARRRRRRARARTRARRPADAWGASPSAPESTRRRGTRGRAAPAAARRGRGT